MLYCVVYLACDVMRCVLTCGEGNLATSHLESLSFHVLALDHTINTKDQVSTKQVFFKTVLQTKQIFDFIFYSVNLLIHGTYLIYASKSDIYQVCYTKVLLPMLHYTYQLKGRIMQIAA